LKGLRQSQSLTEHMSERPQAGRDDSGHDRKGKVVTDDAVSAWFVREVLPLEAILMHYLRLNWRNASDIPDLRQEVYARVFEAAQKTIPDNPKGFLLTTARNLLINLVRREQVVAIETFADLDVIGVASADPEPERVVIAQEEVSRIETAIEELPARMRQAIKLAYFEGLTCGEIAKRMDVTHQVASEYIARGTLILGRLHFDASGEGQAKS